MNTNQQKVKEFVEKYNLDTSAESRVLDLVSEVGEVAKEILKNTDYGKKAFELDQSQNENLKYEIGDVFYSLIVLANKFNFDLDELLELVLKKYEDRFDRKGSVGSER